MKKETANLIFKGENSDILSAIADIMGKEIVVHKKGFNSAADVVVIGDDYRIISPVIDKGKSEWEVSYSIDTDTKRVSWVFIGHKLAGPCYQCGDDGMWKNIYSHGNFGKNCSSGGNWSSGPRKDGYPTLNECINARSLEIDLGIISNDIFVQFAVIPGTKPSII